MPYSVPERQRHLALAAVAVNGKREVLGKTKVVKKPRSFRYKRVKIRDGSHDPRRTQF